jgi:hypothetical protein
MALLYHAEISPSKLELISAWLPAQSWFREPDAGVDRVAAFRFDDPAGQVGIETVLVAAGAGPVFQVPLTYRGAPLAGADVWLVGTTDHSVLGKRWVYDACGDPVYAAALAGAVLADAGQAEQEIEVDGRMERREPTMTISGSGTAGAQVPPVGGILRVEPDDPTIVVTDTVELAVVRRLGSGTTRPGATLTGTWPGQPTPTPLAYAGPR